MFISLGRNDDLTPQKLVKLISSKTDVKSRQISEVKVKDDFSFVTVPMDRAMKIIARFKDRNGKRLATFAKN